MSNRSARVATAGVLFCVMVVPLSAAAEPHIRLGPLSLSLRETHTQCELLGLGAVNSVPYNFPGADASTTTRYRVLNPGIVEASLPAGDYAAAPPIVGGDLGAPFMHGDGRMYFTFGDAWFEGYERSAPCPPGDEGCFPRVVSDDLLATADPSTLAPDSSCIGLTAARAQNGQTLPITWNGPVNEGGSETGVPGPGFSTGRFMFMLVPKPAPISCGATNGDCAAANGLASDTCVTNDNGTAGCYFGECGSDPESPCALRLNPSTLLVRRAGSDFTEARVGEQIASEHTLDGYRGHFSTVSFYSEVDFRTGNGAVWVVGRDSFWATPGLHMDPYLMYHPVRAGQLQDPLYFRGFKHGRPLFSRDPEAARPLYAESELLNNHTSLSYDPKLDGGTWLLAYGGHAQPALRSLIALFVRPTVDALFYDRNAGVYLRWAKHPWGPWSDAVTIFSPFTAGQGGYCENMYFDDPAAVSGFACPDEAAERNAALDRAPGLGMSGEYGVALVPGASSAEAGTYTMRWLVSTWNPYRVLMQESTFCIIDAR